MIRRDLNLLGQTDETKLLGKQRVVLYGQLALGSCRAIDATKVKSGRCERDCIDCEDTEHAELDRQDLVSSGDLDGDPHRELLIGVFSGLFVLLYEVAAACAKD